MRDRRAASNPQKEKEQELEPLSDHFVVGTLTGVAQWPVATAVELAKIQIQNNNLKNRGDRAYRGSIDAARQVGVA